MGFVLIEWLVTLTCVASDIDLLAGCNPKTHFISFTSFFCTLVDLKNK
jgi:hypothetical protein